MPKDKSVTREKILEAAREEFLEKGFKNASMRDIAARAGMSAAGLYRHFDDKELLFSALVDEQAEHIKGYFHDVLDYHASLSVEEQTARMSEISTNGFVDMGDYVYDNYSAFKLIVCCSEGTRYSGFVHELAMLEEDSTYRYMDTLRRSGLSVRDVDSGLCHMICSGLLEGFFQMVEHDMTKEEAKKYLVGLHEFYTAGWERLMGVKFFDD